MHNYKHNLKNMVGNTGTLMTMSIVRSKLRKRDDSSATVTTTVNIVAQQQAHGRQSRLNSSDSKQVRSQEIIKTSKSDSTDSNSTNSGIELETITFTRTSGSCSSSNCWVFPPKAPSPNIYSSVNHDAMIVGERNGFKGFKKQFSGRFKRLVSHKKDATVPIPPELKPQLKTIYVY